MVCFVITTNILLLSALIAILSQSLTKVRCPPTRNTSLVPLPLESSEVRVRGGVLLVTLEYAFRTGLMSLTSPTSWMDN